MERIRRSAIFKCAAIGVTAGVAILGIARWSGQPIGTERGWNNAVLAIVVGPVLEEIIFRGYLLTLALWQTRRVARRLSSTASVAVIFAAAHLGKTGITVLQFACILLTGWVYAWIRVPALSVRHL